MNKHTPGPWNLDTGHIGIFLKVEGLILAKIFEHEALPYEANAKRIVECVNVLEGIDNPAEYIEGCKIVATEFFASEKENAELRSQLSKIESLVSTFTEHAKNDDRLKQQYDEFWTKYNAITGANAGGGGNV